MTQVICSANKEIHRSIKFLRKMMPSETLPVGTEEAEGLRRTWALDPVSPHNRKQVTVSLLQEEHIPGGETRPGGILRSWGLTRTLQPFPV